MNDKDPDSTSDDSTNFAKGYQPEKGDGEYANTLLQELWIESKCQSNDCLPRLVFIIVGRILPTTTL